MSFEDKLFIGPRRRTCQCWDCLRAEGLTPPLSLRSKYLSLYDPKDKETRGPGVDFKAELPR